jgi:hypothetical protein
MERLVERFALMIGGIYRILDKNGEFLDNSWRRDV